MMRKEVEPQVPSEMNTVSLKRKKNDEEKGSGHEVNL